jgi:hypothetical protein
MFSVILFWEVCCAICWGSTTDNSRFQAHWESVSWWHFAVGVNKQVAAFKQHQQTSNVSEVLIATGGNQSLPQCSGVKLFSALQAPWTKQVEALKYSWLWVSLLMLTHWFSRGYEISNHVFTKFQRGCISWSFLCFIRLVFTVLSISSWTDAVL